MQTLSQHAIVYLEDATPLLEETLTDYPTWSARSPQQKAELTRLVHDYAVGEGWEEEDSWADVSFTAEEIKAFSMHVLVAGDNGLPEWYVNQEDNLLNKTDHDARPK